MSFTPLTILFISTMTLFSQNALKHFCLSSHGNVLTNLLTSVPIFALFPDLRHTFCDRLIRTIHIAKYCIDLHTDLHFTIDNFIFFLFLYNSTLKYFTPNAY